MLLPEQVFYVMRMWLIFMGIDYFLKFGLMCARYYAEFLQ